MSAPTTVLDDEAIVELYFARNEAAIRETDRKYGAYLYTVAHNMLRDEGDAEECRNDAYLDTWNAIPPARPASLGAFVTKILRRIAVDRYRERTAERRSPPGGLLSVEEYADILPAAETPESAVSTAELGRAINAYVRGLPRRRRFIFISRYYMAESVESIAAGLGVSPSAVYKELGKMKRGLKEHLEREGFPL